MNLDEKLVEKFDLRGEEFRVKKYQSMEHLKVENEYSVHDQDMSISDCLENLLQNNDDDMMSIAQSESEEINEHVEDDVFLSSDDETNAISNSQKEVDDGTGHDKDGGITENLDNNVNRRIATSIEQKSRKRLRHPE